MTEEIHDVPPDAPPGIAWFDLDGTLVAWDCQLLFRHYVVRRERWRGVFLPVFLACAPFARVLGTARMKRVFLSYLWRVEPGKLARWSADFARRVVAPQVYPELRAAMERARAAGHFLILASASPEFYVKEIGCELGFDLALGTVVETGPFFPPLENHKGSAKVARLREILPAAYFDGDKLRNARGYTDGIADLPMLALCGTAVVVNPGARLAALAEENGWEIVRPARPWKSRAGFAVRALALLAGWRDSAWTSR